MNLKKISRSLLYYSFVTVAALLGPIFIWELWLQFNLWFINKDPYEIIMYRDVHHRINHYWNAGYEKKRIFWGPPYNVFLNRGEDSPERLDLIHEKSIIPSDKNGLTENFLRPKGTPEDSYYNVNINSLGFRNEERRPQKEKDVFRIFVLGSYPAFGSGVNDHETYSAILEKELRSRFPERKIEVWNGGQQGTTAISGYARLVREIMDYQPDLLVWDFGWVDLYFGKDFVEEKSRAQYKYPFIQEATRVLWRRLPRLLFSRHLYHLINSDFRDVLLDDWRRVNQKMIAFAEQHKLPVLLLKQRVVIIPNSEYEELASSSPLISFINMQKVFRDPQLIASKEHVEDFWSKPNWLTEGGYRQTDYVPTERIFRVDSIMYGKYAHRLVAERLLDHALPLMMKHEKK